MLAKSSALPRSSQLHLLLSIPAARADFFPLYCLQVGSGLDVPKATLARRQMMKPSSPSTRSSIGAGGEAKVQKDTVTAHWCQGKRSG